ncbi:MAG: TSUP family transporter [Hyphomicrobiaceae bacterium]
MNEAHILLGLATLTGGFIRGYSGFGGPMTVLPVLNLIYPPAVSIWIMALVDLVANIYLVPTAKRYATANVYVPLVLGSLTSMMIGIYALVVFDAVTMRRVICVAIIVSCCVLMSGWMFRSRLTAGSWLAVGAASGLVLGATLIAVVTSVFINAASQDADRNRANFIIWGFVTGVALVVLLGYQVPSGMKFLPVAVALSVFYFAGCIAGAEVQRRVRLPFVRQITLVLIILIAATSLAASYRTVG